MRSFPLRAVLSSLLIVSGALGACSVSLSSGEDEGLPSNSCWSNEECASGLCSDGMCLASSTEIQALLLEITPPAGTPAISGVRFTHRIADLDSVGSYLEVDLQPVSVVSGQIFAPKLSEASCVRPGADQLLPPSADASVAARITLVPRERLLGLANPKHTAEAKLVDDAYRFSLTVPPGHYDIYVEPSSDFGPCVMPPHLVVNKEIPAGDVTLKVSLPEPEVLAVRVRWPGGEELVGWRVDIVERDAGRVLSNRGVLDASTSVREGSEYLTQLVFSEVAGDLEIPVTELVRLSPPEDVVAPTIYIERSVVELFQGGQGLIDQLTQLATPVYFSGQVTKRGVVEPARASVSLIATELSTVAPGTVAAFSRVVTTDADGYFEAHLLPGKYRLVAEPDDPSLALTEIQVTVSGSGNTQAGRVVEVPLRGAIQGRVVGFDDVQLGGISVLAMARPNWAPLGALDVARGLSPFFSRAEATTSDSSGRFSLRADAGVFDVFVRPEASAGYAWGVRRSVAMEGDLVELGPIRLSEPFALWGSLRSDDRGGVVSSALIRAYAYFADGHPTAKVEGATTLVPVGEARVDSSGQFRLLLPSSFE